MHHLKIRYMEPTMLFYHAAVVAHSRQTKNWLASEFGGVQIFTICKLTTRYHQILHTAPLRHKCNLSFHFPISIYVNI